MAWALSRKVHETDHVWDSDPCSFVWCCSEELEKIPSWDFQNVNSFRLERKRLVVSVA